MRSRAPCSVVALLVALGAAGGEKEAGREPVGRTPRSAGGLPQAAQVYPCYRLPSAVRVDGKLDDAAWAALPEAKGFWVPGAERFAVQRPTSFRMAFDTTHLYLAVRCAEPQSDQLQPRYTQDGKPLYFDNSLELFLMPERPVYYRIAVNAAGAREGPSVYKGQMDAREEVEAACETAAAVGKGEWTMELKVPLAAFGAAPTPGATWGFNLCRNVRIAQARDELFTCWAHLPRVHWHLYDEYDKVRFLGDQLTPPEADAAGRQLSARFLAAFTGLKEASAERGALRDQDARLKKLDNLCLAKGLKTDGSLRYAHDAFQGKPRRMMEVPPHDLILGWPAPVTFDALLVDWDSEKLFATHYGLECWDEAAGGYRLVVEEADNRSAISLHRFKPMTTRKVRFTVFAHPPGYDALIINHFGLYHTGDADAPPKP